MTEQPLSETELELLAEAGWTALEFEEFEEANEAAAKLRANGVESGYRIVAAAHAMVDEYDQALAWIDKGIEALPQDWMLRMQKGIYLSDEERFEDAIAAFDEAAALPQAEIHWLEFNKGVAQFRGGLLEDALKTFKAIKHPEASLKADSMRMTMFLTMGLPDQAVAVVEDELSEDLEIESADQAETMSTIMIQAAIAFADLKDEAESPEEVDKAIDHYVRAAISYHRENPQTLMFMRELNGEEAEKASFYFIEVEGLIQEPQLGPEPRPCSGAFLILADSEEEALEFVKAFEIPEVDKSSLTISESEVLGAQNMLESDEVLYKGLFEVHPLELLMDGDEGLFAEPNLN
ncbi:hypothetical protein [Pontibacter sp. G13]|uniref:hypothetical protein n=1 Tax=Pontibacter sp. G13 TaxID=3074898 RepID=UPI00288A265B|nr:hypothetical protein [Pontibacter sp. G13]WNJ21173.1 hypothetical protein RJD25_11955 [Pontibacter sp. G13]